MPKMRGKDKITSGRDKKSPADKNKKRPSKSGTKKPDGK